MSIEVTKNGFILNGELLPIYSGTMHYWRLERGLWKDILNNVKSMGFKIVETYIPWGIHEVARGSFDFGTIEKNKDIDTFLKICEELGLKVLVRPGPHINAELTYFGYPKRVLMDPEIQAKTPHGTLCMLTTASKQFPVPSYASEKFYKEVALYFDSLAPILKEHLYPKGCIIGLQADNETCYFFKDNAYTMDYSQDSIKLYQNFLKQRYGNISTLNEKYGTNYKDFMQVYPPIEFNAQHKRELPYYFDWIRYKEYQIIYSLRRIARMWKDRGIDVPVYHNAAYQYWTPMDVVSAEDTEEIDVYGIDRYPNREDYHDYKKMVKYLAGTSKMPFIPEFGSGVWYSFPKTFLPDEEEFTTMSVFMHGIKAINFYMIVERDRWQGSPVTRDNRIRKKYYSFYKDFCTFMSKYEFYKYEKVRSIVLMRDYDYGRFLAMHNSYNLNDFVDIYGGISIPKELFKSSNYFDFKYIDTKDKHPAHNAWLENIGILLDKNNYDYDITDTHLHIENMERYTLIILSSYDFMDESVQQKIIQYAEKGGVVVMGPGLPYLNTDMECTSYFRGITKGENVVGTGKIYYINNYEDIIEIIEKLDIKREYILSNSKLELSLFRSPDKTNELLFIANPTEKEVTSKLYFNGFRKFKNAWKAEDVKGNRQIEIRLKPYSIKVWEVEK
ncbi:beta-galactosidase [Caldanaerobius fijiensis DSM 17918]|uniref:Beta-galactosidase n=1 Tax=Caldanaerobius fijiensis DSM 17918 TaxID=1121256 RepID=A0A1M5BBR6_9THEO|nr:beta-galactosidase [Caldanaerobius fijiensis]SHF39865.1 beta-galactosidase [Caldanaerobius fijiensis DSM 17918]